MGQDTKNDEGQWSGPPYIVYRNPVDDPILCALQEAAKQLEAEGKPLVHKTKRDLK